MDVAQVSVGTGNNGAASLLLTGYLAAIEDLRQALAQRPLAPWQVAERLAALEAGAAVRAATLAAP